MTQHHLRGAEREEHEQGGLHSGEGAKSGVAAGNEEQGIENDGQGVRGKGEMMVASIKRRRWCHVVGLGPLRGKATLVYF